MALTGSVLLDRTFISLASDVSNVVIAGSAGGQGGGGARTDTRTISGGPRNYASGVTRNVVGTVTNDELTLTLRCQSYADVAKLRSFLGRTCLFRDSYGRRLWVVFSSVNETDIPLSGKAYEDLMTDVTITADVVSAPGLPLP